MAKLEKFLLAEAISVDKASNRVTAFSIVEDIRLKEPGRIIRGSYPEGVRLHIPTLSVLIVLVPEDGDYEVDWQAVLVVEGPIRQEDAAPFPVNFKFKTGTNRHRLIAKLEGLPLTGPGELSFSLALNQVVVGRIAVPVVDVDASNRPTNLQ